MSVNDNKELVRRYFDGRWRHWRQWRRWPPGLPVTRGTGLDDVVDRYPTTAIGAPTVVARSDVLDGDHGTDSSRVEERRESLFAHERIDYRQPLVDDLAVLKVF